MSIKGRKSIVSNVNTNTKHREGTRSSRGAFHGRRDGETDDTKDLQDLINRATGPLQLPVRRYNLPGPIIIDKPISIHGMGSETVLDFSNAPLSGEIPAAIIIKPSLNGQKLTGVCLDGLTIQGRPASESIRGQSVGDTVGIWVQNAQDHVYRDLQFQGFDFGVRVETSMCCRILDSRISNDLVPLVLQEAYNFEIARCSFGSSQFGVIMINSHGIGFDSCEFHDIKKVIGGVKWPPGLDSYTAGIALQLMQADATATNSYFSGISEIIADVGCGGKNAKLILSGGDLVEAKWLATYYMSDPPVTQYQRIHLYPQDTIIAE